jgi:uncharacterized membrane protein
MNSTMFTFTHGVPWIHVVPALFAVVVALLYLRTKWMYVKIVLAILWLLLLPNTIYIFTDLDRFVHQWGSGNLTQHIAWTLQYSCLGVIGLVTYLVAFLPFEQILLLRKVSKTNQIVAIILLNFFVAFGVVLGKVAYINSYVVFTQPTKVFSSVIAIVTSFNLWSFLVLFWILCNLVYFLFRRFLLDRSKQLV